MQTPFVCLLGFVAWTFLLVLAIVLTRSGLVVTRRARATEFPANKPHGGERYQRLLRAHGNCVENLPLFAAVVLMGQAQGVVFPEYVCAVYLGARVAQSCIHIASGRSRAIHARFVCFAAQLVCLGWMGGVLGRHLL